MKILFALLGIGSVSMDAAVRIGNESAVPFKDAYNWNYAINFQPGDGEHVNINPPKFGWLYATNMPWAQGDAEKIYEFQFQVSSNSNFSDYIINQRTPFNFFNFLAPFTTNVPIYWRVGYVQMNVSSVATTNWILTNATATNVWSTTRMFVVTNAVTWDRSILADTNYLATNCVHPYMLFNAANKAGLYQWFTNNAAKYTNSTGELWERISGRQWILIKSYADSATNATWLTNFVSTNTLLASFTTRAQYLAQIGYAWQLTGDNTYTNRNPMEQLYWTAQYFIDADYWRYDPVGTQDVFGLADLAFAYDLLYPALNETQRNKVRQAIAMYCNYTYHGAYNNGTWRQVNTVDWADAALARTNYTGGLSTVHGSPQHIGSSHWFDQHYLAFRASFATLSEASDWGNYANLSWQFGMNYMINRATPFASDVGIHQGRSYGVGGMGSIIHTFTLARTVFPQAQFIKSPILQSNVLFWDYMVPAHYRGGQDPWGDGTFNHTALDGNWKSYEWGRTLACVASNGSAWKHWLTLGGDADAYFDIIANSGLYVNAHVPYVFPPPAPDTNSITATIFPADGWVFASSHPPNTGAGYTNGVGMVFRAAPRGGLNGHESPADMAYQLWAYGANVTDGGAEYLADVSRIPDGANGLFVDGYGTIGGYFYLNTNYAAKLIAFTNGSDFVYMAGEGVNAYPRRATIAGGGVPQPYTTLQSTPKLLHVQSVQRHILHPRRKYFVMLDKFSATTNSIFSWRYGILEPGLSLDVANRSFSYTATNTINRSNVTVYVAHISSTNSITVTNQFGTNSYKNPYTGYAYNVPGYDTHERTNTLWFNSPSTTNWSFVSVIVPVRWGSNAPTITRLDDLTVKVDLNDGQPAETNTWDTNYASAYTFMVDVGASGNPVAGGVSRIISGASIRAGRMQ